MTNFRSLVKWLVPGWLNSGDGEKVLYTFALLIDVSLQRMRDGLVARFPSYAGESALTLIGDARGILRGRAETAGHYAARLRSWRHPRGHRVRGNAAALLEQVYHYLGGAWVASIDRNGNRYVMAADGTITVTHGVDFGGSVTDYPGGADWGHFWLFIVLPGSRLSGASYSGAWPDDLADPATWGGDIGVAGTVIGMRDWTADDSIAICSLLTGRHPWRPEGIYGEWLVVALDQSVAATVAPSRRWSKVVGGVTVAARDRDGLRYIALERERNQTSGDPDLATNYCDLPEWAFEGDPDSFPTSVDLFGTTYAGNPDSFPINVQLPDDGDLP